MGTRRTLAAATVIAALAAAGAHEARAAEAPIDPRERVVRLDLSGPRLGATFAPDGQAISQFGWHFESQAAPGTRGPWFIVERVLLVGGMERNAFVPTGTLVFGLRLPSSFEFGIGPSLSVGLPRGPRTGIIVAAGHSFRVGGIRIPVNLAFAPGRDGDHRWTLVTGWAIRDRLPEPAAGPQPDEERGGI